ncbi:MAG: DUF938 domain-containing protein [Candidatus Sericytochromatia bacterium]|nr:DUF938 domain-containing protein [Candidatus Sericytochromatia bacterium]
MCMKAFSEACERNKEPILAVLQPLLQKSQAVLEIGSGTGQHAVHFARELPQLTWHASDQAKHHPDLRERFAEAALPNLRGPVLLDVSQPDWAVLSVDFIFSANTLHIMDEKMVADFFAGVAKLLPAQGQLAVYGPFNQAGQFTSEGNARLDAWAKSTFPGGGIKDLEAVLALALNHGLNLQQNHAMPANNRLLHWLRD